MEKDKNASPKDAHKGPIKYGIIAGHGSLLREVITACLQNKTPFFILAFEGQTDPLAIEGYPHCWLSLGQIGKALHWLEAESVTHLVMAGRFRRPSLTSLKIDRVGARWIAELGLTSWGDDRLIRGLISKLEREGFTIVSPETILGEGVLSPKGLLGPLSVGPGYSEDAALGFQVIEVLSPFDFGQAAVVQEGRLLGIEGPEGTNALIKRCGLLRHENSARRPVLIKACKKGQEIRGDRPVVGPDTLKHLCKEGYGGLILKAKEILILDYPTFLKDLDAEGLFCMGV